MRSIKHDEIGTKLLNLIDEENPVDEDIIILDKNGTMKLAIITKEAYEFFLKKVEEEENRIDNDTVNEFNKSGEKNEK